MNFLKKNVPIWTLALAVACWLATAVFAAYQTNELSALREAVRLEERGDVSPVQSLLNGGVVCRRNWLMVFRGWYQGRDVCQE